MTGAPAPPVAERPRPQLTSVALALLFCLPGVAVAWLEVQHGADRAPAVGDAALTQLAAERALSLEQWLGPYSRHRWSHPGPLYYYLLAPAYALGGRTAHALHVFAAVLNVTLLLALMRTLSPWLRVRSVRGVSCVLLAVWLPHFHALLTPSGWSATWGPVILLTPYALLLAVSTRLALGRGAYALPAVALHALLAQTHVAFVPLATAALLFGATGYVLSHRGAAASGLRAHRHPLLAAAVLLCLWSPVLIEQVSGTHNLGQVIAFFMDAPGRGAAQVPAHLLLVQAMTRPLGNGVSTSGWGGAGLLVAAQLLLGLGSVARAGARSAWASTAWVLNGLIQTGLGALALRRVDDPQLLYLTHWLGLLFVWNWLGIAIALNADRTGEQHATTGRRGRRALAAGCILVAALAALPQLRSMTARVAEHPWLEEGALEARTAVTELQPILSAPDPGPPQGSGGALRIADNDAWRVAAGLVLRAHLAGKPRAVEPDWAFMFGPAQPTSTATLDSFLLTLGPAAHGRLLARSGIYHLYRSTADRPRLPLAVWGASRVHTEPTHVAARAGAAEDTNDSPPWDAWRSAAAQVVDGRAPAPGSPWNSDGVAFLAAPGAWISLRLPVAPVERIRLLADHNDTYLLQGSVGGGEFEQLGSVEPVEAGGLRWREVTLPTNRAFSLLRISAQGGDGHYSIAEVEAVARDGLVVELAGPDEGAGALGTGWGPPEGNAPWRGRWVRGTSASLTLPNTPASPRTLVFVARPFEVARTSDVAPPEQHLTVELGGQTIATLKMDLALRDYAVALPAMNCAGPCMLRFRFAHAHAAQPRGGQAHDLAAWFELLYVVD